MVASVDAKRAGLFGRLRGVGVAGVLGAALAVSGWSSGAGSAAHAGVVLVASDAPDQLVMRDGRVIKGRVLEETPDRVRMEVVLAGMRAPTWYQKTDILRIVRGEDRENGAQAGEAVTAREDVRQPRAREASRAENVVYLIHLQGRFGRDIAVQPFREAVAAAKRFEPDYLVIKLDNDWSFFGRDAGEFVNAFDEFSIASDLEPIYTDELRTDWENPPRVIFWVKNAMGGAAFLPMAVRDIYFHSDGRMGGIGNLAEMFEGVGDEEVRQKQRSLRLARAEGMANRGGHELLLVRAMTMIDTVLSVSFDGDRPVYHQREPEHDGEILLTNDGTISENEDSLEDVVRGRGKNVLNLRAPMAQRLRLSRGTVDTIENLVFELGISRSYNVIDDRAEQVLTRWRRGLDRAERELPRQWEQFNEIQVQGTFEQRRMARGRKIRIAEDIQRTLRRYDGAIIPQAVGVPDEIELNIIIEQLRLEAINDRR